MNRSSFRSGSSFLRFFSRSSRRELLSVSLVGVFVAFSIAVTASGQELPAIGVLKLYSGSGTIEVVSADKTVREVSPGELREMSLIVRKGETIRTGKNSSAILLEEDHTGMSLDENTVVGTQPDIKAGHSLSLLKGKLKVKVRPPKDESPRREFCLKMPTTILAVKGTSFFAEVAEGAETGGVNDGKIEAVRLIDGKERKVEVNAGNALFLNKDGTASMRRLSREELGYQSIYMNLETALDDKEKPSEQGFVELCWIPPGKFKMGESNTMVDVEITEGFWMGKYEVTQEEYENVIGSNPSVFQQAGSRAPVENLEWHEAMKFCAKLTERERAKGRLAEGWSYTLPTEAQWEYACRAGSQTTYSFGDDVNQLGEYAWFRDNSGETTHPVGTKKPNAWGLYGMHGNVREWCLDWFGELGGGSDPTGPATGDNRVFRGGSYFAGDGNCRSAFRSSSTPDGETRSLGFRVVLSSNHER